MDLSVPSLVLSVIANCVTGAKGFVLTLRSWRGKGYDSNDVVLTLILLFVNILLLVFSILRVGIAKQVLLSLGCGALILYQCMCASLFTSLFPFGKKFRKKFRKIRNHKYLQHLPEISILAVVMAVSLLSTVLPYKLEKAQETFHLAGLLFFAVIYLMLLVFYGYGFFKSYGKPEHQKQGNDLISDILLSNVLLSSLTTISAVPAAIYYARGDIDFELSLWIKYTAAELFLLGWVLRQYAVQFNFSFKFWRRRQSTIPDFATNEQPATGADSKIEAPHMGSKVTLLSHQKVGNASATTALTSLDLEEFNALKVLGCADVECGQGAASQL